MMREKEGFFLQTKNFLM